jgi:hypothetical protein
MLRIESSPPVTITEFCHDGEYIPREFNSRIWQTEIGTNLGIPENTAYNVCVAIPEHELETPVFEILQ